MMQEMIPKSYEVLRDCIDSLQAETRKNKEPPILAKDQFWLVIIIRESVDSLCRDGADTPIKP